MPTIDEINLAKFVMDLAKTNKGPLSPKLEGMYICACRILHENPSLINKKPDLVTHIIPSENYTESYLG